MKRFLSVAAILVAGNVANLRADTVALTGAQATFSQAGFGISNVITDATNDPLHGWAIDPQEGNSQTAVFDVSGVPTASQTAFTFSMYQNFTGGNGNFFHTIGDFRFSVTSDPTPSFSSIWTNFSNVTFSDGLADPALIDGTTGEVQLLGASPATATYAVTGDTMLQNITGIRLEVLTNALLPHDGPGRQPTNGNFVLTALGVSAMATPLPSSAMGGLVLLAGLGAVGFRRCRFA